MNTIELSQKIQQLKVNSPLNVDLIEELTNKLLQQVSSGVITASIHDEDGVETKEIKVDIATSGAYISVEGYGDYYSEIDCPVLKVDYYNEQVNILVWSDINQEDYTDKVSLERAKLS